MNNNKNFIYAITFALSLTHSIHAEGLGETAAAAVQIVAPSLNDPINQLMNTISNLNLTSQQKSLIIKLLTSGSLKSTIYSAALMGSWDLLNSFGIPQAAQGAILDYVHTLPPETQSSLAQWWSTGNWVKDELVKYYSSLESAALQAFVQGIGQSISHPPSSAQEALDQFTDTAKNAGQAIYDVGKSIFDNFPKFPF